ncbi:MARVEL domain-containing protein 1 [Petromyzon marinus]|uniref:MARVEL domain-containing protein 1 n=1 Tax=Petromyzon marinus TaxID=7757 RepID=UPI003F701BE1
MAQSASGPTSGQQQQQQQQQQAATTTTISSKASRLSLDRAYARSVPGALRAAQLFASAAAWLCVACTRYHGALHFVVFAAVTSWLLTLAAYATSLLGLGLARKRQDRGGGGGGGGGSHRLGWLLCNACGDCGCALLCVAACAVAVQAARAHSFCDVTGYRSRCPHRAYVAAAVLCCLCALLYAASALLHGLKWRRLHRQEQQERPAALA